MTTKLPAHIATVDEAKAFLTDLFNNGEHFHPEDDATDINIFTQEEGQQLNRLMNDIYSLPVEFDPCGFLLDLMNR